MTTLFMASPRELCILAPRLAGVLRFDPKDVFRVCDKMILVHVPRLVNSNNANNVGASEGR